MRFLGYVISSGGVTVDPSKVHDVLQCETLKSITEIQSFMSFDGYYRRFIEAFLKLDFPLTQLTRKGQAYAWDIRCKRVFKSSRRS